MDPISPLTPAWVSAPENVRLAGCEIHVWRASLDLEPFVVERLANTLAPHEISKAERMVKPRDREHAIVARGVLRCLLGAYAGVAPAALAFAYEVWGKPELLSLGSGHPLRFNVSHSHGLALFAFALRNRIGIDIEQIRDDYPCLAVAQRFFSPDEADSISAIPEASQAEAFFATWTRKEALAKAIGLGLQLAFDAPEPAAVWPEGGWTVQSFHPAPRYRAAVACEGNKPRLFFYDWAG
ncbi:MAG: 4'-phosphopantetheinyl transferase family protein [Terriglobia bacterium]